MNALEARDKLFLYTLAHFETDPTFIHQYAVDAWTAQNADEDTKGITICFALIGLYLYLEKGYTGKQVQDAHVKLTKQGKTWPTLQRPEDRGDITVFDVLNTPPGPTRDQKIKAWCQSVWDAYASVQNQVKFLMTD